MGITSPPSSASICSFWYETKSVIINSNISVYCKQPANAALHKPVSKRDQQTSERPGLSTTATVSFRTGEFTLPHTNVQLASYWPDVVMLMLLFTQRQQRIQKDRLMNDFSAALNNFQVVQRRAAERERESVEQARAGSRLHVTIFLPIIYCLFLFAIFLIKSLSFCRLMSSVKMNSLWHLKSRFIIFTDT